VNRQKQVVLERDAAALSGETVELSQPVQTSIAAGTGSDAGDGHRGKHASGHKVFLARARGPTENQSGPTRSSVRRSLRPVTVFA
jgi:hypothetical protein